MDEICAAIRCYNEPETFRRRKGKTQGFEPEERVLVLDTETRVDLYQNLTFGSYQIYAREGKVAEGLFYGEDLTDNERTTLSNYAKKNGLQLRSSRQFIEDIFLPEVHLLHTLCVGFNLPFDLSRLAVRFGKARKSNRGGFSLVLSDDSHIPRLNIKSIDSKRAFISFKNAFIENRGNNNGRKGSNKFKGKFLDLKTLVFALTSSSHSLASACDYLGAPIGKTSVGEHGKVTSDYIDYNRNDVSATYSLYCRAMEEYLRYGLDVNPTKLYSPASIGKCYLKEMNISPFQYRNPAFDKNVLGYTMATYYGGRSEVRIRKTPVLVALIDFLSMYPTMCILQNIWSYVIASRIDATEATEDVANFLNSVSLNDLSQRDTWAKLNAICFVEPNDDILPLRAKYGDKDTYNIGLNYVASEGPMWYALADVVASKLLTGKTPKILKAIRFQPMSVQRQLKPITLMGKEIDPKKDDLFAFLMQYRHDVKMEAAMAKNEGRMTDYARLDSLQRAIKIICNAGSYGIFVEINTSASSKKAGENVHVYGNDSCFISNQPMVESFGQFFNPIIASLITSGSRLVLAGTEAILAKYGEHYAFCDTDSMAVPPHRAKEVQDFFQKLSPYSFNDPIFKMEKENYSPTGAVLQDLWFYGISAKRYVLYNMDARTPVIRKYSLHGLGHVLNPFKAGDDWQETFWMDILLDHYGIISKETALIRYRDKYVVSRMTVSSPQVIDRFKKINKGKPYEKQIKPFNFILIGAQNSHVGVEPVKPIAPFNRNSQVVVHREFIDYYSGRSLEGHRYWKTMDSLYFGYANHKEEKFDGNIGLLGRKHLRITSCVHIGKESNNLDENDIMGVTEEDYVIYHPSSGAGSENKEYNETVNRIKPSEASKYGLSERHVIRWRKQIANGEPIKYCKKSKIKLRRCKQILDRRLVDDGGRLG